MAIKEEKTTQEIKNYALKQQALQEKFAQVKQAVQLIDLTKQKQEHLLYLVKINYVNICKTLKPMNLTFVI